MKLNRTNDIDIDICLDNEEHRFDNVVIDITGNDLRLGLFKEGHYQMEVTIDLDTYEVWHD